MKIIYEVQLNPDKKFAAIVNEAEKTVTIAEYFRYTEGWLSNGDEITILCSADATGNDIEMRRAVTRAFAHFPLAVGKAFDSDE